MLLKTPLCDFGWEAPNFKLKDPDGKEYQMKESLGSNGLLVAFICNHCPYVQAITDRLATDTDLLIAEGINVLAVMSNDYEYMESDSPANMKKFANTHNFRFPYLIDEDQFVGKAYKAICTPDFFGINKMGELQYRGRLDDIGMNDDSSKKKHADPYYCRNQDRRTLGIIGPKPAHINWSLLNSFAQVCLTF